MEIYVGKIFLLKIEENCEKPLQFVSDCVYILPKNSIGYGFKNKYQNK